MTSQEELFQALMGGADPEKLANDYAALLNKALEQKRQKEAEIQKQKAEEEVRKLREAALRADKLEATKKLLEAFDSYLNKYYKNLCLGEVAAADVMTLLDEINDGIVQWQFLLNNNKPAQNVDPIDAFLREFGLK